MKSEIWTKQFICRSYLYLKLLVELFEKSNKKKILLTWTLTIGILTIIGFLLDCLNLKVGLNLNAFLGVFWPVKIAVALLIKFLIISEKETAGGRFVSSLESGTEKMKYSSWKLFSTFEMTCSLQIFWRNFFSQFNWNFEDVPEIKQIQNHLIWIRILTINECWITVKDALTYT